MIYLIFVQLFGIMLMSIVMEEIFLYNKLETVEEIVKKKVFNMEVYLYDISLLRKDKVLPLEFIDACKTSMKESIKHSTRFYFEENHFYQELPPKLQARLVTSVLYR